jgi:hypothetical protein
MADVRLTATNPEDSSVVPVACDASGRLLLEEQGQGPQGEQGPQGPKGDDGDPFSGNFADDVTFEGSATFAANVEARNFEGKRPGTNLDVFAGYAGSTLTSQINADGSATFAGDATVGSATGGDRGVKIYKDGGVNIYNSSTSPESALQIIDKDSNTPVTIKTNGSATFAGGDLTIANDGTLGLSTSFGGSGLIQLSDKITLNGATGSAVFQGETAGGSANFAGNKAGFTAEGYLWCTTVRGDTVMLDATSNGMGVWVDYTPRTRIDEIRDRLDANRGDTGEMPADTP